MSDIYEVSPGLLVTEDGEIVEASEGTDAVAMAVYRLYDTRQQIKAHEQYRAVLEALILKLQPTKIAQYQDFAATVRNDTYTSFDVEAWRRFVEDRGLDDDEAHALALAAKGFDTSGLSEELAAMVNNFNVEKPKRAWVNVQPIRKPAPKAVKRG